MPMVGTCRRRSPVADTSSDIETFAVWPPTADVDWCGEHPAVSARTVHRGPGDTSGGYSLDMGEPVTGGGDG